MRIKKIRISGFKPIPFCAEYTASTGRNQPAQIKWKEHAFQLVLATEAPFLNAIIGPNSSGKSSIFYALNAFFANKTKLPDSWYNRKDTSRPVIIEITFVGVIESPDEWHNQNCTQNSDGKWELTIAHVWEMDATRVVLIKQPDGTYQKASGTKDKPYLQSLLPEFRLLPADKKLSEDANLEKNDLISDLIDYMLEGEGTTRNWSIIYKLQRAIENLRTLADRSQQPNATAWKEIEELEQQLSDGLGPITPGNPSVRIQIDTSIPELSQIFRKGKIEIDDGIELDFSEHGMGLQRSFAASALYAWSETIANQTSKDYIFAIEEPELYLHPHATRVFLKTLEKIAAQNQVVFTSHSSEFVNRVPLDNVTSIRRNENERRITTPNLSALSDKEKTQVNRFLREHRSDMLFARSVLLVEGASELYAIPVFAQTLGYDFDRTGASVVFVNGKQNFKVYHHILDAFDIPHIILGDGDGNASSVESQYLEVGFSDVYILEFDFEYEVVRALEKQERRLEIYNECRLRIGKGPQSLADIHLDLTAVGLKSSWWEAIRDKLHADIHRGYRSVYDPQKDEIKRLLREIAEAVIRDNHLLPNSEIKRWASLLKKQGKPLVGRVVGDMLTREEIEKMPRVVNAIERVNQLAQSI